MDQRIIQHGEFELTANMRDFNSKQTGTRVYVSHKFTQELGDGPRAGDEGLTGTYRYANGTEIKTGELLITRRDEFPDVDRAWDRFNRGIVDAQRQIILDALTDAPGIAFGPGTTFSYSKYAGCSCPCSPGFIVKHDRQRSRVYLNDLPIDDLWINEAGTHQERLNQQAASRSANLARRAGDVTYTKSVRYDKLLTVLDDVAAGKLTADQAFAKLNES